MSLSQESDSLSEDEIFNLLSSSRRRCVLRRLLRDDEPVGLQQLADEIAAQENDKTADELTDRERKRVYVSLYQTHVPTMADAGVIEYDPESGRIVPRAGVALLRGYLTPEEARPRPRLAWHEPDEQRDITWQLANAGLAVTGFAALVIAFTSPTVDPVTNVGAVALGALGAVSFAVLAVRWTREGIGRGRRPRAVGSGVWMVEENPYGREVEPGPRTIDVGRTEERWGASQHSTDQTSGTRPTDRDER